MGLIKDILGDRFGKWVVIDRAGTDSYGNPTWLCQCDCGTWKEIPHRKLINGQTHSCGCERRKARKPKLNKYILTEDTCKFILSNGEECLFDREDYPKISQYRWSKHGRYIGSNIDGRIMMFHRLIIDCPEGMVVDHINRNPLDNRKCNLRICTPLQNSWNTVHPRYKSEHRGVTKLKSEWVVRICVNHEIITIGRYKNFEDAVDARLKAEKFYFGEFAPKE